MNLLALDTSTEACSVALLCGDRLSFRHELAPRKHAEQVLPWIEQLLAEAGLARAQLDAIAVGRGPGGFTGVRLAVAVAQGLAFGLDRPLLPVSSLAALAMQAGGGERDCVLAAIDARMGELYLGAFRIDCDGLAVAQGEEWMATPISAFVPIESGWRGVGSGYAAADGTLRQRATHFFSLREDAYPDARAIARLGRRDFDAGVRVRPDQLEPAYLRDKVAQTLVERGVK